MRCGRQCLGGGTLPTPAGQRREWAKAETLRWLTGAGEEKLGSGRLPLLKYVCPTRAPVNLRRSRP